MGKGVKIGLRNLVYALLDNDPTDGSTTATYLTPVKVPGVIQANVSTNSSSDTVFADDGPYETASTTGQISIEINLADLPLETQAAWLGSTISGGILLSKSGDVPPWVAIGFKTLKSNGKYRYVWYNKGKFSVPDDNNESKGDSVSFKTPTITGTFVKRDCDDEWRRQADEDHTDYVASIGTNWFNSPYGGTPDTTAPTITSVAPANAATAVVVSSTVVWTFNEALTYSTITPEHFMVVKDTDGSNVAGSLSVNGARTVVTFTPSANLTAATAYRAIVTTGVKNLGGLPLVTASVTKFTTA